ncbi:hypothetical protein LY90DRAFT_697713 [Neocallimastix californiae]|jgi:hypothetical protein|uniref:RRM domain-containing protein n=1 Tax=Neocallimastix californiae TaxID=1754190 RepID=A0A1Y2FAZ1_9FUNG|nr:hypothetical protein LY90DRAFT_697713 [Neocallimastix californiae]|eukprot:ORY81053.1 hypothetical protein LY90DRAFT_697713 [Neocallimastix californiae]
MEEITTIFVVGFPDDMNEREFQNMFIFNQGFEAATLKIPAPNKDGRKQIIGFAKFHTKMDALNAMEVLTGRQIDFEKGSVLKAEMAKKNLHTKKIMMNMYYPASSMKNTCMQYYNSMPDNINNCINFNNNMANNPCNPLLNDDNKVYPLNNLNRGISNPAMGPLTNNFMMPGARERNGNMNTVSQPFMDQNLALYNGNRNLYKLPNYQNMDMNHSAIALNNSKPTFDKLYKNGPGNSNSVPNSATTSTNSLYGNSIFNFLSENTGVPKGLKQPTLQNNNLFSFNKPIQKPLQQQNTIVSTSSGFINNVYRQPSSLLDSDFSINNNNNNKSNNNINNNNNNNNNNQFNSTATNNNSVIALPNNLNTKFNKSSVDASFSNDLYTNNFNYPLSYFTESNDMMKNRTSLPTSLLENGSKDTSLEELKKKVVSPLSNSSTTTPLFFSSPINKTPGFMDSTLDISNKFCNLSLNNTMNIDKSVAPISKGNHVNGSKDSEEFDETTKDDNQTTSEKAKTDLDFTNISSMSGSHIFKNNNFTFNLFSGGESSPNILDSLNKNDSVNLISKFSSSSMNLPYKYKKSNFEKLNEKEVEPTLKSSEGSSSTINSDNDVITNGKSNTSLNSASEFTLNEGAADNKTEPESSIFSSLSNLTSEPIIPPQVYSSSVNSKTIANESN